MNKHTSRQTTIRVRTELITDAEQYCGEVGLTLNALVAVALSDFLRLRRRKAVPSPVVRKNPVPVVGVNEPCPCESGRKYKKCCGNPLRAV